MPVHHLRHRRVSRCVRALAVLAAASVALTACAAVTDGKLGAHAAPNADLNVKGVSADSFDTLAQNALSDITTFYETNYPKVSGGKAFVPLKGGFYSVDGRQVLISGHAVTPATDNKCIAQENDSIVDNAMYCDSDDSISWDRSPNHLLPVLVAKYGDLLAGLIFAHEYGHAISARLGIFDNRPKVIYTESQADCAAGAWAASALKGDDPHFVGTTQADLDKAFAGYLNVRDSTPDTESDASHGNGFDRLSALADGLDKGVTYCFSDKYFSSRKFTERPYTTEQDYVSGGNESLADVISPSADNDFVVDLNRFWTAAAKSSNASTKTFTPVKIAEAAHPPCASAGTKFGYCPDDNTVYYDSTFAKNAYYSLSAITGDKHTGDITVVQNQPADFALGVLFSMGWGMAVRHQLFDRSLDGGDALLAAACYSGSYAKDINVDSGGSRKFTLSPEDLDEAVSAMLNQVGQSDSFGARKTTGLGRIQAFVKGYAGGLSVC